MSVAPSQDYYLLQPFTSLYVMRAPAKRRPLAPGPGASGLKLWITNNRSVLNIKQNPPGRARSDRV